MTSDSEASEDDGHGFGYMAADVSDHGEDDDSDEFESASEGGGNVYLDMEASEESEGESETESDYYDGLNESESELDHGEQYYFPQFKRLPLELRQRIWELSCPDLTFGNRVYSFICDQVPKRGGRFNLSMDSFEDEFYEDFRVKESPTLGSQTETVRAVLATCQESRAFALRLLPDTLSIRDGRSIVRFNKEKDMILTDWPPSGNHNAIWRPIPGFSEHVRHLAIERIDELDEANELMGLWEAFPRLEAAYFRTASASQSLRSLWWIKSENTNRFFCETREYMLSLGENSKSWFCWPDLDKHRDFAEAHIPVKKMRFAAMADFGYIGGEESDAEDVDAVPARYRAWPLVEFTGTVDCNDIVRYQDLMEWEGEKEELDDETDEMLYYDQNEYESDGIDDSDLGSDHSDEGDEDDLAVLDDDDHGDGEGSTFGGFSPVQPETNDGAENQPESHETFPSARFSSPESDSATVQNSDGSDDESDEEPQPRRPAKRSRVVASDSEDGSAVEEDDEAPRKRARFMGQRGARVVADDDEDDDQEDEDRDDDKEGGASLTPAANDETEEESDSEDSEESEEDEDEEDDEDEDVEEEPVIRPLTLAERLQLHRQENPIPSSDEGEVEDVIEEMRGDDYDARDYANFQDDEEGNELSDGGGEGEDQRLVMNGDYGEDGDDGEYDD
ncbi:hypothetical protein QBC46DRAFT_392897 [Diplogelasinospora grovesii]|uniref:2EXR domain-containing protein n=1 Tax=Diplogelasinospora grovesii TaxID=303347 RepID=A0AAN6N352_9PEZI|nr:hypothetical protein QBC46DRAFT_392897 [Diplogelasinospora grovesii]